MSDTPTTILLVEDDPAIADGLALNLKLEGFEPSVVVDGRDAIPTIRQQKPALILLDISLPNRNGLEILGELRESGDLTPVIVLSARQNEADKVSALRLGADDYVTKPFGVAELLARIEAVLRRLATQSQSVATGDARMLKFGSVEIDLATHQVTCDGKMVALTNLEFELLVFFVQNPDRVFTRNELLQRVWGVRHRGSPRTVDNFVAQLRAKLEETPNQPDHFLTVRSKGYRFLV